jgi:hypothetical protein
VSGEQVPNNKITVSEDKLDAKLARLELNLVDRITGALETKADQAYVESLHARVHTVESAVAANGLLGASNRTISEDHETRLRSVERFKNATPSAAVLGLLASIAAVVVAYTH